MSIEITDLQNFRDMVFELQQTTSSKEKKNIVELYLTKNTNLYELFVYTYNKDYNFYLESDIAISRGELLVNYPPDDMNIVTILNLFRTRDCSGTFAWNYWKTFINTLASEDLRIICNRILDKDLKCGLGMKTLNSVLKKLKLEEIPDYQVALANLYDNQECVFNGNWTASRKMDGIRCSCICSPDSLCVPLSRNGKEFHTLSTLKNIIGKTDKPLILDGELSLITPNDEDDFQGIMKEIFRKNHDIKNIRYHIFDIIYPEEGNKKFLERYEDLLKYISSQDSTHIKLVEQIKLESREHLERLKLKSLENGWEGLILRKNDYHKPGKTNDMFKVKEFKDVESRIVKVNLGEMSTEENGIVVVKNVMTSVIIDYKGFEVGVGSGWTLNQRLYYYDHPELLVGRMLTVKYFEEIVNDDNSLSLRFPIMKCLYDENDRQI